MSSRGRGWRRIGIVLSVIWFVGLFAFVWTEDLRHHGDFYSLRLQGCSLIRDQDDVSLQYIRNDRERENRRAANETKYQDCRDRATTFYISQVQEAHSASVVAFLVAIDLATVLIGWLVTWGVVLVVRWIARGFEAT